MTNWEALVESTEEIVAVSQIVLEQGVKVVLQPKPCPVVWVLDGRVYQCCGEVDLEGDEPHFHLALGPS